MYARPKSTFLGFAQLVIQGNKMATPMIDAPLPDEAAASYIAEE